MQLLDDVGFPETMLVKLALYQSRKLLSCNVFLKQRFNVVLDFDVLKLFGGTNNASAEMSVLVVPIGLFVDILLYSLLLILQVKIISLLLFICLL